MSEKGTSRRNWFTSCRVSSSHFSMHVRFLLIDGEPIIFPVNDKIKKKDVFLLLYPKNMKTYRKNSQVRSRIYGITGSLFSIQKRCKNLLKWIKSAPTFARHAQTPHIEPKESGAVYIKNSNDLVPRTFPIPLHASCRKQNTKIKKWFSRLLNIF